MSPKRPLTEAQHKHLHGSIKKTRPKYQKKETVSEYLTGQTPDQLAEVQRGLRAAFYSRSLSQ